MAQTSYPRAGFRILGSRLRVKGVREQGSEVRVVAGCLVLWGWPKVGSRSGPFGQWGRCFSDPKQCSGASEVLEGAGWGPGGLRVNELLPNRPVPLIRKQSTATPQLRPHCCLGYLLGSFWRPRLLRSIVEHKFDAKVQAASLRRT